MMLKHYYYMTALMPIYTAIVEQVCQGAVLPMTFFMSLQTVGHGRSVCNQGGAHSFL